MGGRRAGRARWTESQSHRDKQRECQRERDHQNLVAQRKRPPVPRPGRSLLSKGEGLALHRRDAPVTWSTLAMAMAMVPAVVSGVLGYLPENPERQQQEPQGPPDQGEHKQATPHDQETARRRSIPA